jgi:hypothetical protein
VQHILIGDLDVGAAGWEYGREEGGHVFKTFRCESGVKGCVQDAGEPVVVVSIPSFGIWGRDDLPVIIVASIVEEFIRLSCWRGGSDVLSQHGEPRCRI